jgi:hypothetical protein
MADQIEWDDGISWEEPKKQTAGQALARGTGLAARAGITGVAAVPAMLADAPVAVGNIVSSLFGGGTMQLPSQALQRTLTAAGLPEPQTGLEKALSAGAEAATGTGALAQAAKATGSQLLAPLTQRLGTQTAASGTAGAAAQPAAELVTEKTESPLAGTIAALATGMAAGTLGARGAQVAGRVGEAKLPTLAEIKQTAQAKYGEMSAQGINLKPQSVLDFVSKTETELGKLNLNPKLDTHKPVATVLEDWKDMVGQQRVSFDKLEQMRSKMNDLRASKEPATRKLAGAAVAEMDAYGTADPLLSLIARFNPERSQLAGAGTMALTANNPLVGLSTAGAGFAADRALSAMRRADAERLVRQMGAGQLRPEDVNTLYSRMFGAAQGANE